MQEGPSLLRKTILEPNLNLITQQEANNIRSGKGTLLNVNFRKHPESEALVTLVMSMAIS